MQPPVLSSASSPSASPSASSAGTSLASVLLLGGGGREHALALALAASKQVRRVWVAPGNGGTDVGCIGSLPTLAVDAADQVIAAVRLLGIDLVVVGPEAPLAAGLVDALTAAEIACFGPTQAAAQLESSKVFAKAFMDRHEIPTARWRAFTAREAALAWLAEVDFPVVVKASGLAAGKGVFVPANLAETRDAIATVFDGRFGAAAHAVILEERLEGPEISVLAFCDGARVALMPAAQDHKRALEGDRGPNTGGMGAFAPTPRATPAFLAAAEAIIQRTVDGMANEGNPLRGVLYAGFMCTPAGPRVLEFNVRFGDPEAQVILPLLDADLYAILAGCAAGQLDPTQVRWRDGAAATVVAASGGYPGAYHTGHAIEGIEAVNALPDVTVYHAGTRATQAGWATRGGRVLAVTGQGTDLARALDRAYLGLGKIAFEGMHMRRDIGAEHRGGAAGLTYRDAGVDIDAAHDALSRISDAVRATHGPAVLGDIGAFGGLFSASAFSDLADPVLVASTDGVGTKTRIATALGRFDTIGVDLVNHCVNDTLVQGARPLFFLDYVASSRLDPAQVAAIVKGCADACAAVGCALLGGETAEMPGVYHDGEVDLVGTLVGVVDRSVLIDGTRVAAGDAVLALPSSGLHTNGYSLARRIIEYAGLDLADMADALLAPHRCYLREVEALWAGDVDVRGLVHITGGGLIDNPPRILGDDLTFALDLSTYTLPALFAQLQAAGNVSDTEMRRTFNLGVGLLIVLPEAQVAQALARLPEAWRIGRIIPRDAAPVVFV